MNKLVNLHITTAGNPISSDVAIVVDSLITVLHHEVDSPREPGRNAMERLLDQARAFLKGQKIQFSIDRYPTVQALLEAQEKEPTGTATTAEIFFMGLDRGTAGPNPVEPERLRQLLAQRAHGPNASRLSPYSFTFFLEGQFLHADALPRDGGHQVRSASMDTESRRADILRTLLHHIEHRHVHRLQRRIDPADRKPSAMALQIAEIMNSLHGSHWDTHAYTGSVVSSFIHTMKTLETEGGRPVHGGPNEHSLACAALAGWQLFGRAFLIVVTSGMIDEFKGTLANLQRAAAPGLIVCAEASSGDWFPFQGTVNAPGDARPLLVARGIPHFYVETMQQWSEHLPQIARLMETTKGPVVVLATAAALESTNLPSAPGVDRLDATQAPQLLAAPSGMTHRQLDEVLDLINRAPVHVLWQCGALSGRERRLAYRIAHRAGIALCDSVTHPGGVCAFDGPARVPNYLGTLGIYGSTRRIHEFLHTDDRLNPRDSQWVFFLKSRLDQAATPFPQARLANKMNIVQINSDRSHIAPFADVGISISVFEFLEYIDTRIDTDPSILSLRRKKIDQLNRMPAFTPSDEIPTIPLTPNHFFYRLNQLLEKLITQRGYRYTGVFDVGRGGISAIRNLPRTDPGFSGWYGRALMGDAAMAMPFICLHSPSNVLAFIGDGARAMIPDVEPHLLEMVAKSPGVKDKNITVFYLNNGVLSIIQSYIDVSRGQPGGEQVRVPRRDHTQASCRIGSLHVHRSTLVEFDDDTLESAITEPGRVNFFDVLLAHTTSGDGLSLVLEPEWSRQPVDLCKDVEAAS